MRRPGPDGHGRAGGLGPVPLEALILGAAALVVGGVLAVSVAWWAGSGAWPLASGADLLQAAARLVRRPGAPFSAVVRGSVRPEIWSWVVLGAECGLALGVSVALLRHRRGRRAGPGGDAQWELRRAARQRARQADTAQGARLVVGLAGRRLVTTAPGSSLLVIGPTRTGKTSGLVVPALLEWEGPVLATSVRADLVRATLPRRVALGTTWVFDPARSTDLPGASWDPLQRCRDAQGARRIADALVRAAPGRSGGLSDGDFWFQSAAKLLAPLLLAAGLGGRGMGTLVEWLDCDDQEEPGSILEAAGERAALRALGAFWAKDDRYRSSVLATAEVALDAFAEPGVLAGSGGSSIDLERLFEGPAAASLFLIAPPSEQQRLRPLLTMLVSEVLALAYRRAALHGRPLDPRLLVMLDEAANIAPLEDLDRLASTAAGEGIQLVSVWQDLAQIEARYATRWATVVSNHRARLVLPGVADPTTLEHLSALTGEVWRTRVSSTRDPRSGTTSLTSAPGRERLVSPAELHGLPVGHALFVESPGPPALVRLRPWHADRRLCRLAGGGPRQPTRQPSQASRWPLAPFAWNLLRQRRRA